MNEEQVSAALFLAAGADTRLSVLSWQSVDGKGYFAADVKLRLGDGRRVEPDLIVCDETYLWLIEVKATHFEALADEQKLGRVVAELGEDEIVAQVRRRARRATIPSLVVPVVAYALDNVLGEVGCHSSVRHLDWGAVELATASSGLRSVLRSLLS